MSFCAERMLPTGTTSLETRSTQHACDQNVAHGLGRCAIYFVTLLFLLGFLVIAVGGAAVAGSVLPVDTVLCAGMKTHGVIGPGAPVDCSRLSLVKFGYVDFEGRTRDDGQIVVMDAAARHVVQIFTKLRESRFPIAKARLLDRYEGNDDASMADNNTSSFNARKITGGHSFSLHAYGLAIDINPIQNPYVKRVGDRLVLSPPAGIVYANRLNERPWKNPRSGMAESAIDIFADEGFVIWGGYWDDPIDYQHFQVSKNLAEQLAALPSAQAGAAFERYVERYRTCRKHNPSEPGRTKCIVANDVNVPPADGPPSRR